MGLKRYRTVFLGTPGFATPILETLAQHTNVVQVITQPDRPAGRGRKVAPCEVKCRAEQLDLPVIHPASIKGRRFANSVAELKPDFLITAAFGRLVGRRLLSVPTKASLNVHASLLPKLRGAAPINWAIINGEKETGVSIMEMAPGLDTGPVYLMRHTPIDPNETAGELTARLSQMGAIALLETLEKFDQLTAQPQQNEDATWAPVLQKGDGKLDWTESAVSLHNRVRGLHPWPCCSATFQNKQIKIHTTQVLEESGNSAPPGHVLEVGAPGIDVACGRGSLRLLELQAPGKKRLCAKQFLAGARIRPGDQFL